MSGPVKYIAKMRALSMMIAEFDVGRGVVIAVFDKLEADKRINFLEDPYDRRKQLISEEDLEKVRRALRREDIG